MQDGAELMNVSQKYKVANGKVTRSNPFCPRCGKGVFMRDAGEFRACGKCGDRIRK
jgi:small subunit ribosomal protein S27Ae